MKPLFITGIGTDVGKTIISAILVEKLQADYWKPVQSGDLENSDTMKVRSMVANTRSVFHPEAYRLTQPFSPHKSADLDNLEINIANIIAPHSKNRLIIEGAGGLLVPLNKKDYVIDLIQLFNAEVLLVSRNYLGSINHTLLSIELLKHRNIPIKGIIFNGEADKYSEEAILNHSDLTVIGRIPGIDQLSKQKITESGKHIDMSRI